MTTPKRTGRRVTVELDELDCELICSALKIARTTRSLGKKLAKTFGGFGEAVLGEAMKLDTPECDEREKKLIELLTIRNN
jgi:hypothetical protein